ncbi:MFS transporter [Azospirillum sp. TSO22-1]|uniref:MFS transporter n=1 Tax=Azospirillum sp. TSO22-1 TaxID=716789 RepID=UPI001FFF3C38|nr:MFS transporter [Azospirillum sp. TSO22-1]
MTERKPLPRGVWALGLVSLLMDLSSEMIHSLLPVFLVSVLGASALSVGIIEGIAEATSSIVKLFSGTLSDRIGRRKPLALLGYGMAAVTKPLFPLASSVSMVLAARFVDRVGKGIRGAPRDALVADLTPPEQRGAAYGLRQALDTVGAVLGPLAAMALMALSSDDVRLVFWVAALPAVLCVAVLALGVREPPGIPKARALHPIWTRAGLAGLGRPFWALVAVAVVMTLARFSEAFLVLRAQDAGLALALVPAVMVAMNVTYTLTAYPVGALSDRIGRHGLLLAGFAVLILSDAALALADGPLLVLLGAALWGVHMGMTQGLLSALVADGAPADRRGTAFGVFNLVTGVALLAASVLAGALWSAIGPAATFWAGAGFSAAALLGLLLVRRGFPL